MKEARTEVELILISRLVRPGCKQQFEEAITEFVQCASRFPGCIGTQVVSPGKSPDVEDNLHHVLLAFDNVQSRSAWEASSERALYLSRISPFIEGKEVVRGISGLAHWFQPVDRPTVVQPPRWKVAVVTWLGIFPTLSIVYSLIGPLLTDWSVIPRIFVMTILVVCLMSWVIAPRLTKLFKPWLYRVSALGRHKLI